MKLPTSDAQRYSAIPKGIFSVELDNVASAYWKRPDIPENQSQQRQYASALAKAYEALLVSPRVTFKVYGENVVLACLTRFFGPKVMEQLLDDGTIDFVLWKDQVVGVGSVDVIRSGVQPIASMALSSSVHCDPEASVQAGLRWLTDQGYDRRQLRSLTRRAQKRTSPTPNDVAAESVAATMKAFHAGSFGNDTTPEGMVNNRALMLSTASHLFEASVLAERELDLHEGAETWGAMLRIASELRSSTNVPLVAEAILREEQVPAIQNLLFAKVLLPADIVRLRGRKEIAEFQEWLWTQPDPADSEAVLARYRDLILKGVRGRENTFLQNVRLWGLSALAALLGDTAAQAAGAGPLSHVLGMATGLVANTAVGGVLAEGDRILDRILRRDPRRFASKLRDEVILASGNDSATSARSSTDDN